MSSSVAAAAQAAPVAEPDPELLHRLRALPADLDDLEHVIWCARSALAGPDPEAGVEYLRILSGRIREVLDRVSP